MTASLFAIGIIFLFMTIIPVSIILTMIWSTYERVRLIETILRKQIERNEQK
jgi:hypothetical protein